MNTTPAVPPRHAAEPFSFAFAWTHLSAYWCSRACLPGLGALLAGLLMIAFENRMAVYQNDYAKLTMDAAQARNLAVLMDNLTVMASILVAVAMSRALRDYAIGHVDMDWRSWQTRKTFTRWLSNGRFHRIERGELVENADQRIAEDLRLAVDITLRLLVGGAGLVAAVASLATFAPRLYAQSGLFTFTLGGNTFHLPGLMLWVAMAFALLLIGLSHGVGHRLSGTEARSEGAEADFRFGLIRTRENAEQIAFYGGGATERLQLGRDFAGIRAVWWRLILQRHLVSFVNGTVNHFGGILPALVFAPRVISAQATLGDLTQVSMTFAFVVTQLTWFSRSYTEIAQWTGVLRRLNKLHRAMDAAEPQGIESRVAATPRLSTPGLVLRRPDGQALVDVPAFEVGPGDRVLLRGPSGVGKSTLLRALAGLWPHGQGRVEMPDREVTMFLPQRPYLPLGTLAEVLSYPSPPEAFDAAQYREALAAFGLGALAGELSVDDAWHQRLSPGEQQRIAAARVLLQRPQFLIVDEATSALDEAAEQTVYRTLVDRLPRLALLSVAHTPGADAFHNRVLVLAPRPAADAARPFSPTAA